MGEITRLLVTYIRLIYAYYELTAMFLPWHLELPTSFAGFCKQRFASLGVYFVLSISQYGLL